MNADTPRPPAAGSILIATAVPATPFVMNAFVPSRTKASSISTARVRIAAASSPARSGQAPNLASRERRHVSLALRLGAEAVDVVRAQELCAHIVMPIEPSIRDSSSTTSAYATWSRPAPPYSGGKSAPRNPSAPSS
jgi:hypothetical protein